MAEVKQFHMVATMRVEAESLEQAQELIRARLLIDTVVAAIGEPIPNEVQGLHVTGVEMKAGS